MNVTRAELLMGRDVDYPLDAKLDRNLTELLVALNAFRLAYGAPMLVSSGYRPGHFNKDAGGAAKSSHVTCEACDFHDTDGAIDFFAANRLDVLERCGLYLELPSHTPGWSHLTTRPPSSGKRIFTP